MQEIPIISLSSVLGKFEDISPSSFKDIAKKFGDAMTSVGFAYLVNHGVDFDKIEHIHNLSKTLFHLPQNVKGKYKKTNPGKVFHGYAGPGDELLNEHSKNSIELREFFDVWGFEQFSEENFPKEVPGYKASFDDVRPDCNNLAKKLLLCLGLYLKDKKALQEKETFFVDNHKFMDDETIQTQSQFRTLHYYRMDPNDPNIPENAIRCGEHADWGTITLLFQDEVGGLEVKRRDLGGWIEATPIPGSILVNAAQLLELWTAGIFQATPHRVRILNEERVRTKARQSFIYFINPDGPTIVKPVVKCPPGDESFLKVEPKHAYNHYTRLIEDATGHY